MTTTPDRTAFAFERYPSPSKLLGWLVTRLKNLALSPFYQIYESYLSRVAHTWKKPHHLGVIMDGNRRFGRILLAAETRFGHEAGADKLRDLLTWCHESEIPVVTVWAFSIDNFKRPEKEVQFLFDLFERRALQLLRSGEFHENQVRVRFFGKLELVPKSLLKVIREVEEATADFDRYMLNIALAYGGREEIVDAFGDYLTDMSDSGMSLEEARDYFSGEVIEKYLYTRGVPEPDLIVRTSGEVRLSGFMLWQSAHSEYYFCDTNWPAFRRIDFLRALRSYDLRSRRYGR